MPMLEDAFTRLYSNCDLFMLVLFVEFPALLFHLSYPILEGIDVRKCIVFNLYFQDCISFRFYIICYSAPVLSSLTISSKKHL